MAGSRRRPARTPQQTVARAERNTLLLGIGVLAFAALVAVLSTVAINGMPWSDPYRVEALVPADAPIVRPGDEVRVAGQRVGEVSEVAPDPEGRRVVFELSEGEVGEGATATVRLRGLAGAVFIELDRGDTSDPAPSGAEIGARATSAGTQLTDVIASFDAETRAALGRNLTAGGFGLAGRGEGLNRMLADLPPTLERSAPLLEALRPAPGELERLLASGDTVLAALAAEQGGLAELITGGRVVAEALASERDSLGAAIEEAPGALAELERTTPVALPLLSQLDRTVTALGPTADELERALPVVDRLLSRTDELDAARRIAGAAQPVIEVAGPVIESLDPSLRTLGPLVRAAEPLAAHVSRYPEDVIAGPHGFTTWGRFAYDLGQAPGSRAVRFTPVLTCAPGRNPYPEPNAASADREPCF